MVTLEVLGEHVCLSRGRVEPGAVAGTTMSRTELIGITATGRGLMPGYSDRMTAGEIESVADFVLAMGSGGEAAEVQGDGTLGDPTDILAVPDPATLGRRVFSNLCAACHGETGRGSEGHRGVTLRAAAWPGPEESLR